MIFSGTMQIFEFLLGLSVPLVAVTIADQRLTPRVVCQIEERVDQWLKQRPNALVSTLLESGGYWKMPALSFLTVLTPSIGTIGVLLFAAVDLLFNVALPGFGLIIPSTVLGLAVTAFMTSPLFPLSGELLHYRLHRRLVGTVATVTVSKAESLDGKAEAIAEDYLGCSWTLLLDHVTPEDVVNGSLVVLTRYLGHNRFNAEAK